MQMRFCKIFLALSLAAGLVGCGEGLDLSNAGDQTVFIMEQTFTPSEITTTAGSDVIFFNDDGTPHRILSQSAADQFDNTGSFDSLPIPDGEVSSITIPDSAQPGDQFFFYDEYLEASMVTPNGVITIE